MNLLQTPAEEGWLVALGASRLLLDWQDSPSSVAQAAASLMQKILYGFPRPTQPSAPFKALSKESRTMGALGPSLAPSAAAQQRGPKRKKGPRVALDPVPDSTKEGLSCWQPLGEAILSAALPFLAFCGEGLPVFVGRGAPHQVWWARKAPRARSACFLQGLPFPRGCRLGREAGCQQPSILGPRAQPRSNRSGCCVEKGPRALPAHILLLHPMQTSLTWGTLARCTQGQMPLPVWVFCPPGGVTVRTN